MNDGWKALEVFIPNNVNASEVLNHIRAQIRIIAAEAGEFVTEVRVGVGTPHSERYRRWTASYLPGPPGQFPLSESPS